ncbi:MAG TPA: DUF4266 domain-containing protein [Bacteroidetes bacterium]|nr:DUF4266 domain-containing protein [Bacteroidota bacterium]
MKPVRYTILMICAAIFMFLLNGCAAVKPFEREYLGLKIMDFAFEARENAVESHWLETLEGSSGGSGGSGGGCACN